MNIAIICDNTTQCGDANLTICYNLAKEFQSRGHNVCILGHCVNPEDPLEEVVDGIPNYRFYYPINRINRDIFSGFEKDHSFLKLAWNLLKHPATANVVFARVFAGRFPIEREYIRLIKKIYRAQPLDMAIACGGAFYPIHALAKCAIPCRRIGYMLDPYYKHVNAKWYYKRKEFLAWKKLDRIVIPQLLEKWYDDPEFEPYRHKLVTVGFPGIAQHPKVETPVVLSKEKTNLLFAGNFYEHIRSPEYLLSLLDSMDDTVCLNILGGIYGNFSQEIKDHMAQLTAQGKLKQYGIIPAPQSRSVMRQADILVNIGNTIDNMLPSKIFEFFSTGKPVIHIQKIENCPCLPYMEQYQNALLLSEQDPVADSAAKMDAFCKQDPVILPFAVVESRFHDCTIPYVANLFLTLANQENPL